MDNNDYELFKNCLGHTYEHYKNTCQLDMIWYASHDTQLSVARILDGECYFTETSDVIYFFEKPWKFETDMQELVLEYETENKIKFICTGCRETFDYSELVKGYTDSYGCPYCSECTKEIQEENKTVGAK